MKDPYLTIKNGLGFREVADRCSKKFGKKYNHAMIRSMLVETSNKVILAIGARFNLSEEEVETLKRSTEFHNLLSELVRSQLRDKNLSI